MSSEHLLIIWSIMNWPLVRNCTRLLSTTPVARKTAGQKMKETGDMVSTDCLVIFCDHFTCRKVNKKAGQTLAAGIEKGEQASEAVKETMGNLERWHWTFQFHSLNAGMKTERAERTAHDAKEAAEQKAEQVCIWGIRLWLYLRDCRWQRVLGKQKEASRRNSRKNKLNL